MQIESFLDARTVVKRRRRINYERVRVVLAEIKAMHKNESDRDVKIILAEAGLQLNKLLLK